MLLHPIGRVVIHDDFYILAAEIIIISGLVNTKRQRIIHAAFNLGVGADL